MKKHNELTYDGAVMALAIYGLYSMHQDGLICGDFPIKLKAGFLEMAQELDKDIGKIYKQEDVIASALYLIDNFDLRANGPEIKAILDGRWH